MAWKHYALVFRLMSPLHIGYRRVGNLMETRRYVPGKNLWAALTARITRASRLGGNGQAYQEIGQKIRNYFRFSYLWPSLDGGSPYFPWEHDDFDYLFLDSTARTPIDHDRYTAEEGGLHDIEFISPVSRDQRQVYLLGDIWVKEAELPLELERWKDLIPRFAVGGEQTYGWGRLEISRKSRVTEGKALGFLSVDYRDEEVDLSVPSGKVCTSHALASGDAGVEGVVGPVEPLVGWELGVDGRYRLTEDVRIAYAPGARTEREVHVSISPLGLWMKQK